MTFIWSEEREKKKPRDEYDEYIDFLRRTGQLEDEYMPKAEMVKRDQELTELVKKLHESGHVSSYGSDDDFDNGDDSEEKHLSSDSIDPGINITPLEKSVSVIGEKASLEDTSSDDEIGEKDSLEDTSSDDEIGGKASPEYTSSDDEIGEKSSPEDKLSDDDIGGKQGTLSDTPAAVSEEKLLHDKKRKSIVLSLGHISMKTKKMKIDEDIGVASQDKNVIALVTGVFDKVVSFEKVLKNVERMLMLHVTQL